MQQCIFSITECCCRPHCETPGPAVVWSADRALKSQFCYFPALFKSKEKEEKKVRYVGVCKFPLARAQLLQLLGLSKGALDLPKENSHGPSESSRTASNRPKLRLCFGVLLLHVDCSSLGKVWAELDMTELANSKPNLFKGPAHRNAKSANTLRRLDPTNVCFALNGNRYMHCLGN